MTQEAKIPVFTERFRLTLLERRVLVLDGVLDDDNGTMLAAQFLMLADEDPAADIALWINSPGGSVPSMLAIRDVMRLIPCDVATLAFGIACSAGQFLLSAGTHGKRFALPHARILMHQGVGRDRRYRRRGRTSGRRPAADQGYGTRPDRDGHRPAGDEDLRGLQARPLVLRGRGQGVRLRRRHSRDVRPADAVKETAIRAAPA
jgi:hypothetical protein